MSRTDQWRAVLARVRSVWVSESREVGVGVDLETGELVDAPNTAGIEHREVEDPVYLPGKCEPWCDPRRIYVPDWAKGER